MVDFFGTPKNYSIPILLLNICFVVPKGLATSEAHKQMGIILLQLLMWPNRKIPDALVLCIFLKHLVLSWKKQRTCSVGGNVSDYTTNDEKLGDLRPILSTILYIKYT